MFHIANREKTIGVGKQLLITRALLASLPLPGRRTRRISRMWFMGPTASVPQER